MQTLARIAKAGQRPAALAAATAAATASVAPVALADAPASRALVEDLVIFQPDEIDEAFDMVLCGAPQPASSFCVEDSSDPSLSSDDALLLDCSQRSSSSSSGSEPLDLGELCLVAKKLLQAPGVQREICSAALNDPEVFAILARQADLGGYLEQTGFATRGLLTPGECESSAWSAADDSTDAEAEAACDSPAGDNLVLQASRKVADGVEGLGLAVARLGGWMRAKLTGEASQASAAPDAAPEQPAALDRVLGAVMVVCVAVVAVLLLRRPAMVLRRAARA